MFVATSLIRILSLAVALGFLSNDRFAHAASLKEQCAGLLVQEYRELNTNAAIAADEYRLPNRRSLSEYIATLNLDLHAVGPDDLVLDSGGGYGTAFLDWTRRRGVRSVVVNVQDNYAAILAAAAKIGKGAEKVSALKGLETEPIRGNNVPDVVKVKKINGVDADIWMKVARGVAVDYEILRSFYPDTPATAKRVVEFTEQVVSALSARMSSGEFQFSVGYAEEVVPAYRGRVRVLTDFWGAFTYSPARAELLEIYYAALTPEGEARIIVSRRVRSKVVHEDGRSEPLVEYLLREFPNIFSIEQPRGHEPDSNRVLVMRRDPAVESFDLRSRLEVERAFTPDSADAPDDFQQFTPPHVTYLLKDN